MTPEQVAIVSTSADALRTRMGAVVDDFYRRLFAADPGLRGMFTSDPVRQRQKFVDEFEAIVDSIATFDEFLQRTRLLGARHAGYGVRTGHYQQVRTALFEAFGAALGARWTPEVDAAWRTAYDLVAEAMMLGASPARPALPVGTTASKPRAGSLGLEIADG